MPFTKLRNKNDNVNQFTKLSIYQGEENPSNWNVKTDAQ